MRIVSLLPSATEIVCALDLEDQLVGVTHECDHPRGVEHKPKVTRTLIPADASSQRIDQLVREQLVDSKALYTLDFDTLRGLAPDLIITQTLCAVCAVDDREVRRFVEQVAHQGRSPRVIHLEPTRLGDVLDNIREVADAAGVAATGARVVESLEHRIDVVRVRSRQQAIPLKVVVLEWLDPLFSCGHWTPELVEIAGGIEPLAQAGQRSRQISMDELVTADPDLIVVACCGFSVERTIQDVELFLAQPPIAALRCVRDHRVRVVDGSAYFSRPGPRLVDSLEILAHAMNPDLHALPAGLPAARLATR
jgi:iron complex transport system substrate-binding protein